MFGRGIAINPASIKSAVTGQSTSVMNMDPIAQKIKNIPRIRPVIFLYMVCMLLSRLPRNPHAAPDDFTDEFVIRHELNWLINTIVA